MIRKLTKDEFQSYADDPKVGMVVETGAAIPDACTEVIIEGNLGWFLVSVDEWNSKETLKAIGGTPKTEDEKLAEELNVSPGCAIDILYLRTRSRWTQELEDELIRLHKEGNPPNIMEFGCGSLLEAELEKKYGAKK